MHTHLKSWKLDSSSNLKHKVDEVSSSSLVVNPKIVDKFRMLLHHRIVCFLKEMDWKQPGFKPGKVRSSSYWCIMAAVVSVCGDCGIIGLLFKQLVNIEMHKSTSYTSDENTKVLKRYEVSSEFLGFVKMLSYECNSLKYPADNPQLKKNMEGIYSRLMDIEGQVHDVSQRSDVINLEEMIVSVQEHYRRSVRFMCEHILEHFNAIPREFFVNNYSVLRDLLGTKFEHIPFDKMSKFLLKYPGLEVSGGDFDVTFFYRSYAVPDPDTRKVRVSKLMMIKARDYPRVVVRSFSRDGTLAPSAEHPIVALCSRCCKSVLAGKAVDAGPCLVVRSLPRDTALPGTFALCVLDILHMLLALEVM